MEEKKQTTNKIQRCSEGGQVEDWYDSRGTVLTPKGTSHTKMR